MATPPFSNSKKRHSSGLTSPDRAAAASGRAAQSIAQLLRTSVPYEVSPLPSPGPFLLAYKPPLFVNDQNHMSADL